MCFTGKSENLAETQVLKDFFIFVFLYEGLYTLTKCQILIKNFNFLGYVNFFFCVNFH